MRRLALLLVVGLVTLTAPASASVTYVTQWGGRGGGEGQFGGPVGLAATPAGTVFVSDVFNGLSPQIQAFTSAGTFLRRWGSFGLGDGQLLAPGGIAVGPSGTVYVGDFTLNRIQRFSPDGAYLGQWGAGGGGAGQFAAPWGIATDARGDVFVVDYGNSRIQKFGADGAFVDQWGSFGSRDGQFRAPTFIATDAGGHVYVADSGNGRIQKFDASGRYLTQWPVEGFPLGVATDPQGNLLVVGTNSIRKYSPRGRPLTSWGSFGTGDGQFRSPQGIATDAAGNVYVGDSGNARIQQFHDTGPPYPAADVPAPVPARPASTHKPPQVPRDFTASGRYFVPDLGIDVPITWKGSGGDSKMVAGGRDEPIWFVNMIRGNRLYTVTYRWPGVTQPVPCSAIPGTFSRRTLNAWLARSSFVGREVLQGHQRRAVDHWRVAGTLPALPPGNFLRLPIALGDVYVDRHDPTTIRQVLHFGVQNLYDPDMDEWFRLDRFSHQPAKVALPRDCPT